MNCPERNHPDLLYAYPQIRFESDLTDEVSALIKPYLSRTARCASQQPFPGSGTAVVVGS